MIISASPARRGEKSFHRRSSLYQIIFSLFPTSLPLSILPEQRATPSVCDPKIRTTHRITFSLLSLLSSLFSPLSSLSMQWRKAQRTGAREREKMARQKWRRCGRAPLLTKEFSSVAREGEASKRRPGCRSKESGGTEYGGRRRREKGRKERGREWRKKMKIHARWKRFQSREKEEWIGGE